MKRIQLLMAVSLVALVAMMVFSPPANAQIPITCKNGVTYASSQTDTCTLGAIDKWNRVGYFADFKDTCSGNIYLEYRTTGVTAWTAADTQAFSGTTRQRIDHIVRDNTHEVVSGMHKEVRARIVFAGSANALASKKYDFIWYVR